ncbi:MAG: hypothetical protein KI790_03275 [Cyclobacteriaceae bacterium]|nr:hypothetical protein [Cyclobacteriaceae bacterium HetDA_MAG_MS6]
MTVLRTAQIILLLFITIACSDDEPFTIISTPSENSVRLSAIEVGQKSTFLRYTAECGDNFEFTGDSLYLSVFQSDNAFIFEEKISESSFGVQASPIRYEVQKKEGYLLIPDRSASALFFFYGNDTIFFNKPADVQLRQENCKLVYPSSDVFIGEEIGQVDMYQLGSLRVIQKTAVSCVPGFMNMDAYLMYDEYLYLSHSDIGGQISGWFLVQ